MLIKKLTSEYQRKCNFYIKLYSFWIPKKVIDIINEIEMNSN